MRDNTPVTTAAVMQTFEDRREGRDSDHDDDAVKIMT